QDVLNTSNTTNLQHVAKSHTRNPIDPADENQTIESEHGVGMIHQLGSGAIENAINNQYLVRYKMTWGREYSGNGSRPFFIWEQSAWDEETPAAKKKRPYVKKGVVEQGAAQAFAARYAELKAKQQKPEQERFATNGKRYISTDGLTKNEIYKLLH